MNGKNFTIYVIATALFCVCQLYSAAQNPNLPTKNVLSQTLLNSRSFTNGTNADTVTKPYNSTAQYTLEVVAKVNTATGRGLDVEGRNAAFNGFRLSLDTANLKNSSALTATTTLSASRSGENQTIRIAVRNDSAHIFQNGAYIQSFPVTSIKDIVGGVESTGLVGSPNPNQMPGWAGTTGNFAGAPNAYGWGYSGTTNTTLFAAANSTTAGSSRFLDVNTSSTGNVHTYNATTYTGRVFYLRWDDPNQAAVYYYPITLDANTTYNYSMLSGYASNGVVGGGRTVTVGVGPTNAVTDRFSSHTFNTAGTRDLSRDNFTFTSQAAGTYYLTITGDVGLFSIAELSLNKNLPGSLIPNWAGIAPNTTGTYSTPASYGWAYTPGATAGVFVAANGGSSVRLMDSSSSNQNTYAGSTGPFYSGRVLYIRWDNNSYSSVVFRYPVVLEANTTYDFSMLHAYASNATGSKTITVGIGKDSTIAGRIASHVFVTTGTRALKKEDFTFTTQTAGLYYLTFNGDWALFSIAEPTLSKINVQPRFIFGKNYPTGSVDMQITAVTYDSTGAYAPAALVTNNRQTVTLTGNSVQVPTSFNTDFVVPGKTDAHFNASNTPYSNSSVALNSNDAWLFFDNVQPSKVISDWLPTVTVSGSAAVNNTNVRISAYKNGTVVIPNGNLTSNTALQVFTQPLLASTSTNYPILTIFNNLGNFNNAIRSFKLKRGYMVTFANNADGSGFSRVFIANDSDLVINNMPVGLDTTISFLRVMKWNWISKKGKAGWDPNAVNCTWYYDWNIGGDAASPNYDYAGIRQNNGWPAYTDIINKGVNHISGFNEPDDANQSNLTVDQAYDNWSGMYSTGLRVGSPAPANPESSWITNFLAKCDSFNKRVDYVPIHCYWGGQTPAQWYSRLLAIYNRVKRPLWITEWNNGANWTTETWPTDTTAQFTKQYNDMVGILNVLDTASFVERYAEYDWVQNKRALVLATGLTPAGVYYAANKSNFAYSMSYLYVNNWRLVSPRIISTIVNNNYFKTSISWNDINGELGSKYTLERKINGRDTGFMPIQDFTGYITNSKMNLVDSVYTKATYRLKAIGLDTTISVYSGSLDVIGDNAPVAPTNVTGAIVSATKLNISWNTGANVRSYNMKRSLSTSGPFQTIVAFTTALTFQDTALTPSTTYYYVVTTLNTAGESSNSTVLAITTPALVIPAGVVNPRIASGDTKTTLTWDFIYDAKYAVLRSITQNGTYDTIANNVDAVRFDDLGRTNNTTYYYKLVPFNNAGFGPESAVMTATPIFGQFLHINFNENNGAIVRDEWGAYNGTLYNSPVWGSGKDSATGALTLVKSSSSYIQLTNGVVSTLNDFTIATWIKLPTNQGINTRVFDFGNNTSNFMILIPWITTANGANMRYKITCATGTNDKYIPYALPLGTWQHVVISQTGAVFKVYVNGALQYTDSNSTVKPSDMGVTTQNYLGRSQYSTDAYSDHVYDDFRIYDYALSDQNVTNLYSNSPFALPVGFMSFEGNSTFDGNLITWHTATETNNDHFVLQKAFGTANVFEDVATIKGKGTTSIPSDYRFLDKDLKTGIYYYRLKQVDMDGDFRYSKVVAIASKSVVRLSVYPNPVSSLVTVSVTGLDVSQAQVRMFNILGQQVLEQKTNIFQNGCFQIDVGKLATGIYQMQVSAGNSIYALPIIKK